MKAKTAAAKEVLDNAKKQLVQAVREDYPVGAVVRVKLNEVVVTIKIGGLHSWWASPGEMYGINVKTGKVRHFYPSQIID